jgi:hypothetical protein
MRLSAALLIGCLALLPLPAAAAATEGREQQSLNAGWSFALEAPLLISIAPASGSPSSERRVKVALDG